MLLRTNLAGYYQDYNNIQRLVPVVLNGLTTTSVQNAAKAKIKGVEGEFTFVPRPWATLSGFFSQVQPQFDSFQILQPNGSIVDATKTAPFAGFPKTTFGITGRFNLPLPEDLGQAVFQAKWYHQSSYISQDTPNKEPLSRIPGYGLLDLRFELNNVRGSNLDLALFANNALNKHYITLAYSLVNEIGFASTVAGAPAMYGVEARYHFR